ncbi:hypothetical protein ACYB6N_02030 [Klebsiella pneumoniae]|uniref:hypothetical protein n=1 Tax=Enterobacteriaceae TaxID=543 RepID=UPI000E2C4D17|nr:MULTISPECIES: hypothetical protein [Enterobacteriaceae]EMF0743212.1 hypothetical protein [Klebsiella aerogenes]MCW9246238.1 hypothetical protein [Klebsiella pneumoniae]QAX04998.1 hypothetical protein C2M18_09090 [Klebsiella pneumoniae]RLL19671.1 hypothetical protein D9K77_05250 [Klebsiella pneumoniae]SXB22158.1 Uncharacterised protein [Klebsiella pneumoniae]
MKNRFLNMLNNPVPHPDLTDAIFNSVSEPELCLTVLKALPEINQVTIAAFFSGQGLSLMGAALIYEMVLKAHDSLVDLIWNEYEVTNMTNG